VLRRVVFSSLFGVVCRVSKVPMRNVRMMAALHMVAGFMMVRGFAMVLGCLIMVLGCLMMMRSPFVIVHCWSFSFGEQDRDRNRPPTRLAILETSMPARKGCPFKSRIIIYRTPSVIK
jgi:hypothetical protein